MSKPAPWKIKRVDPKGRSALHYDIVDARGEYVMGGFGYWEAKTLRRICRAVNAYRRKKEATNDNHAR